MAADPRITKLAREIFNLKENVRALGSSAQLQYSSFEDGSIQGYSGDQQVMQIGRQWDGTYTTIVTNGPVPPTPSAPIVTDATEALVVQWDGTFAGGLLTSPMDFLRVDVHIGGTAGFTPDHTNRRASFISPQGGSASITLAYGTWYVKLVCWSQAGQVSAATDAVEGDAWPIEVSSDGFPPASSPAAEFKGGLEVILAKWTPIVNPDPVTYQVHISTTSGFTPDSTTLVARTTATQLTIKALPGLPPVNPGDPDPREIQYDTTYYVRIVAEDADGAAAPGAQAFGTIFQVTGDNIAADTIRGNHIIAGEITGDLFSSTMVISSAFWTALAGQRAGFTPDGFFAYRSDDSPIFRLPTDGSNAFFDGEMVIRGATVTGGLSIQNAQNEVVADGAVTLMRGIVAPSATPNIVDDYERILPSTASIPAATKNTSMGSFDLVPSEVSQIEYKGTYWVIHQVRANGTRSWFFDLSGNPVTVSGFYFNDHPEWQIYSTVTLSGSSVPARDGVYTMFKWTVDGIWYLHMGPTNGIARYSLRNATQTPVLGCNADDIFISEVLSNGSLQCNFVRPLGLLDVPAAFSVRSTPASCYGSSIQLTAVQFRAGGYGTGAARYYVTQRYNSLANLLVNGSAGGSQILYPGGSSDNWASADKDSESFEAPGVQRRGTAYDGTNFWTYGSDGYLYKHTNTYWNPNFVSSKIWAQATQYDGDSGGTGLHETTPGPAVAYTWKRRSRFKVSMSSPPPDNGGADDPDRYRFYVGRGATKPTNSNFWLQYTGLGPTTLDTLSVASSNPPTVNGFPSSNPAQIKNDDSSLYLKGDGSARFVTATIGPAGGTARKIQREEAFWYGYMAAATSSITNNTNTLITGFTPGDPNETGEEINFNISFSSGVFTVTDAGWYNINVGLLWAANATGIREIYFFRGNTGGQVSMTGAGTPHATQRAYSILNRKVYLLAGGQFRIICKQTSGGALDLIGDATAGSAGQFSYINIDRIRS